MALALYLTRSGQHSDSSRSAVAKKLGYDLDRTADDIRPDYRFNEPCQETVPRPWSAR
ncbi:MAG: hypothetical protein V2J42_14780 [Wenzhouxiangella sp.]|jgi:hypothetical protein|nr:hypothetical protein [Wenzhouxiangella sp.]